MKSSLRIIFLLFLNFYVAALLQVSGSVGKVYFFPQRTETFFSLIFKWIKCFLLAEVSHGERRRREKRERARPASNCDAFYHVAADQICAWNLTRFQNRFCLMRNARALYRLHAVNFWAHCCYRANRFCKLCRTWLKCYWLPGNASACVIENTSEAGRGSLTFL